MSSTRKGNCLCGAVSFETVIEEPHFHVCHCETCRKWGAPAMACPVKSITVKNGSSLKHFSSSEYAERGFCGDCGSHLYWRMKDGSYNAVHIGVLHNSEDLLFQTQLFVDAKPDNYSYANDTAMITGEQLFAMFK